MKGQQQRLHLSSSGRTTGARAHLVDAGLGVGGLCGVRDLLELDGQLGRGDQAAEDKQTDGKERYG
eukprot:SAG22_NODE_9482_length_587_cov_1.475410_1_plen_65_part_10